MNQSRLLSFATAASLVLLLRIPSAAAQADTVPGSVNVSRFSGICWADVRPAPRCRAWVVTEFTWERPISLTSFTNGDFRKDDFKDRYAVAIGPMFNHRPNAAAGVIFAFTGDDLGLGLLRAEGRYRRWVGSGTGVDFGVGFAQALVPAGPGLDDIMARGITGGIGVDYRWIGVDARYDWLNGGGRSRHAALVGAHTSSYGTGVVWAVGTVLGAIAFIAMPFVLDE
jgi:hypothetical protein